MPFWGLHAAIIPETPERFYMNDVQVIAVACCGLFIIAIGLEVHLSSIKHRLDKIIEILENRP